MSPVAPAAIARNIDIATEPPVSQRRLSSGIDREVPGAQDRHRDHRQHQPRDHRDQAMALGARQLERADHQDRRQRGQRRRHREPVAERRPEAGVPEPGPQIVGAHPVARRELPRQDAVDPEQAADRRAGVEREEPQAQRIAQLRSPTRKNV
jgi:hypothetical protein